MAAAVARHQSPPNLGNPISGNSSPMDTKKNIVVNLEGASVAATSTSAAESKTAQKTEPLAPPPKPGQAATETPDYFAGIQGGGNNHFSLEPNPFEQSFGNPSTEAPGKSLLPPVAALESPAVPGSTATTGFNWANSLRSGPLSPAMLAGPAGSGDYFDGIGRGFPTPNESSLRTGLTPGGGGSMFPAPSPNSQAIFQQLQSGGATPGTLDFHRTAMTAAARTKNNFNSANQSEQLPTTSAPMDSKPVSNDPFASHDQEAANGLFMLAKGGPNNAFPSHSQPAQVPQAQPQQSDQRNARNNGSIGSISGVSGGDRSVTGEHSDSHDEKPSTRGKSKKNAKGAVAANGRRMADDTTQKGSNKRAKGNNGGSIDPALENHNDEEDEEDSQDEGDNDNEEQKDTKKMTDEEKRKNFLERNRVAALKCRQRKKQWLANLQAKVEIFSSENDALTSQVTQLREEIVNLKTLLLAHKDCPISQAQGLGNYMNSMQDPNSFSNPHANPYGMAMQSSMQPQMQRS